MQKKIEKIPDIQKNKFGRKQTCLAIGISILHEICIWSEIMVSDTKQNSTAFQNTCIICIQLWVQVHSLHHNRQTLTQSICWESWAVLPLRLLKPYSGLQFPSRDQKNLTNKTPPPKKKPNWEKSCQIHDSVRLTSQCYTEQQPLWEYSFPRNIILPTLSPLRHFGHCSACLYIHFSPVPPVSAGRQCFNHELWGPFKSKASLV